jgi:predicted transcriptional regulator
MPDETPSASVNRELATKVTPLCSAKPDRLDQFATLMSTVHQALASLGKQVAEVSNERTPAVPMGRSVYRDYVVCQQCGGAA